MYVERLLQINTAMLAALGTLLLGMGQRNANLSAMIFAVAMFAVWVTDEKDWFHLSRGVAGLLQVTALVLTLAWLPLGGLNKDGLILALARLLVFWQMIVLFQKKDARIYWHQTQLSLLQVVVAGLLTQGFFFGAMLIVYLVAALCALTLIFLYEERNRHRRVEQPAPLAVIGSRWPLARQEPVFSGQMTGRLGVEREMFGRIFKTAVVSLMLSTLVFFLVPRFGQGAWRGSGFSPRKTIGYNDEIRLGGLGEILENPHEVLRVRLTDAATGQYYPVGPDIYLRGTVLTTYSQGRWKPSRPFAVRAEVPSQRRLPAAGEDLVRQKITIEPLTRDDLFCVWPFRFPDTYDVRLVFDRQTNRLVRPREWQTASMCYELLTTAFHRGEQSLISPNEEEADDAELLQMPTWEGRTALPGLSTLAKMWIDESQLPAEERYARARLLERRIRDSGRFRYSLKGQSRDFSLDPIEDFVVKHPEGHCEYFATALAMMLRSQGIPSRVVLGYRCDERSTLNEQFLVRQSHAHTWVEVRLDFEHIPAELRDNPHFLAGGWLRLDPTPGGDRPPPSVAQSLNWLDYLWNRYVVQMDRPQQQEAIYSPVADAVKEAAARVTDLGWWRGLFRQLRDLLGLGQWGGEWMDGLLAATLAVLIALPAYRILRWLWTRWTRPAAGRAGPARQRPRCTIAFYRRLEAALARHGLVRPPSRTQREFARDVDTALRHLTGNADLAALPGLIVEAFYRVRFGGVPLDKHEADTIEKALTELERIASTKP